MFNYVLFNSNPYQDTKSIIKDITSCLTSKGWRVTDSGSHANLALSIGGDGTFLDTVRTAPYADIIGINKGTLGYLTEVEEKNAVSAIQQYCKGEYEIENRMMLSCICKGTEHRTYDALNDIVVTKRNSSVIDIEIMINKRPLARYYADGVIISTPTGSTGYAFSCGAPIIDPLSEMIIITPIAPHTLMNRSICIPSNFVEITIKVHRARNDDYCKISVDGQSDSFLIGNDIIIKKSMKHTKFVKFNDSVNFVDRIAGKFNNV